MRIGFGFGKKTRSFERNKELMKLNIEQKKKHSLKFFIIWYSCICNIDQYKNVRVDYLKGGEKLCVWSPWSVRHRHIKSTSKTAPFLSFLSTDDSHFHATPLRSFNQRNFVCTRHRSTHQITNTVHTTS